jgi:glycosyltransferase involved in cell wall biosynthesis
MKQKPIRIAQVVGQVVMGGVDSVVMNYYRHIDKSKFQFDFFMDGYEDTPIDEEILSMGGRIFKLPTYEDGMRRNLTTFRRILKENNYKILHCHMNTLSVFWLREAKGVAVPVRIAHSHSTAGKGETKRNIMKYALRPFSKRYPNQYCACSHYAGRWLFGDKFYVSGKVNLVRNAIDTRAFIYNEADRAEMRAELGISDELVIGHVGRFMFQKNHEFLIEIFAEVIKLQPNSILLLVGDGPRIEEMKHIVANKGLYDKVVFTGVRRDVPKLMQAMDCFVLPSRYEGLGMVVVEAQTAGLPCYISNEVPSEAVLIPNQCKTLNLESSPKNWAIRIVEDARSYQRVSNLQEINEQGYDIHNEVKVLEEYYKSFPLNSVIRDDGIKGVC